MNKVLVVGNHQSVNGGITTVINQIRFYDWKKNNISMKFIPTYFDTNILLKILFFIFSYLKIFFTFMYWRPNCVHIHMSYKGSFVRKYYISKLAMFFNIKIIIHLHGSEFEKWYLSCSNKMKNKIKYLLRSCNYFIVLGENWKKTILSIEPSTNIVVINNTVSQKKNIQIYDQDVIRILFMGVLIKRKGVHDLIEAVAKSNFKNNIEVVIAGSGEEETYLRKKVAEYGLNNSIKFIGWVTGDKKEELYRNSKFIILPSYNEGLPMSILEGMSYGIPIISTNVGDISSCVINNKTGFIINPGDIKSLVDILEDISVMDKSIYKKMSNNCLNLIEKKFSDKDFYAKLLNIYNDCKGDN